MFVCLSLALLEGLTSNEKALETFLQKIRGRKSVKNWIILRKVKLKMSRQESKY